MSIFSRSAVAVLGAILLFGVTATHTSAQSIQRQVIGNGATMIYDGSGNLLLGGTVGQTIVGVSGYEAGSIDLYHGFWYRKRSTTGVNDPVGPVAGERNLWNSPNPFSASTQIHFEIPSRSSVRLRIFDMDGKLVKTLLDGSYGEGSHSTYWDATNELGQEVATGYYYYTLDAQPSDAAGRAVSLQQKMLLMK